MIDPVSKVNWQTEIGIDEYKGTLVNVGPSCHESGCRGYGSTKSGVVFVGIAPGRDEVQTGRPLTGPSGRTLNNLLRAIGLKRQDVYCTNLICWWKDNPSREEADACSSRLRQELLDIQPKLIILLGKIVAEIFTGRPFSKVRGAVQWNEEYNCYVMATYHPAALLHSLEERSSSKDNKASVMIYDLVRDLLKINEVVTWQPGAPNAKVEYTVITDYNSAQHILNSLPRGIPVALDVETNYDKNDEEVEVFENQLLCVGVGTSDHAYVFTPTALFDETNRPALEWPNDIHWTMQNALFDVQVMRHNLGVWIDVKEDTMLQSYSLDERAGVHGLKQLAREYLAAGFWEEERFKGKVALRDVPPEVLYKYNAADVVYTARLCTYFWKKQLDDGVREHYERILIGAVNLYKKLQYRGITINHTLIQEFGIEWIEKFLEDEELLQDIAEQEGFNGRININSSKQLGQFLYKILSLPIIKYTKGGTPSCDEETLEKLRGQHEFIDKLLSLRHLHKMISVYILGFQKRLKIDGKAHPIVKINGQRNGRPSYTKPPIQTIPVPYVDPTSYGRLRELFVATNLEREEYVLIEADYSQAELWMAYGYSKDQQMYADLISGDYHSAVAKSVLQKEQVTKEERGIFKRVNFGVLYDIEENSLSELVQNEFDILLPPSEAKKYINGFHSRNKKYSAWAQQTQEQIKKTGELVFLTGRKRRIIVFGNAVRAAKQAVNAPIQGTTSDVVVDAAIEIQPKLELLGGSILFTVHDSIVSEVPLPRAPEAIKIIHDAMTAQRFVGVPRLPVEIKQGTNWAHGVEVHVCSKEHCLW